MNVEDRIKELAKYRRQVGIEKEKLDAIRNTDTSKHDDEQMVELELRLMAQQLRLEAATNVYTQKLAAAAHKQFDSDERSKALEAAMQMEMSDEEAEAFVDEAYKNLKDN